MAESLLHKNFTAKVSSVLNKDTKQFGKKYMFDGKDETCWNSDEGSSQYVLIDFDTPVIVSEIRIQYQGGFASNECTIYGIESIIGGTDQKELTKFYPNDTSSLQCFPVTSCTVPYKRYKLLMTSSTDFYGRIVIYHLDLIN